MTVREMIGFNEDQIKAETEAAEKDAPQRAQKEINTQKMSGDLIEEGK